MTIILIIESKMKKHWNWLVSYKLNIGYSQSNHQINWSNYFYSCIQYCTKSPHTMFLLSNISSSFVSKKWQEDCWRWFLALDNVDKGSKTVW